MKEFLSERSELFSPVRYGRGMGVVLAFIFQFLQEERIDGLIERLGEDDHPTRSATAEGLLTYGKTALPALHRVLEKPPSDEVKFRAQWLADRILEPIREELQRTYGPRGADVDLEESTTPYLPACRLFQWSYPCRCCALHRGGHGSVTVALCLRDGRTFVLRSTAGGRLREPEPSTPAKVGLLARYLRPVENEKDAVALAEFLIGPRVQEMKAETTEHGIVVHVPGICDLSFDPEGRLLALDARK